LAALGKRQEEAGSGTFPCATQVTAGQANLKDRRLDPSGGPVQTPEAKGRTGREELMPLKLSLKPGERFVVNGAVLQNGDRRAVLLLQNKASILREKDIIQPEDVNTPGRRIYFPIMMMYLDPPDANRYYDEFVLRLNEFMGAIRSTEILKECVSLSREVMAQDYYKALTRCRKLLTYEQGLLGNVHPGLPDDGSED
jgi:flagellar protein FlbT